MEDVRRLLLSAVASTGIILLPCDDVRLGAGARFAAIVLFFIVLLSRMPR
jgi:hypothetical protein